MKMNMLLIAFIIGATSAARLENTYLPPSNAATAGGAPGAIDAPYGGSSSGESSRLGSSGARGSAGGLGRSSSSGFGGFSPSNNADFNTAGNFGGSSSGGFSGGAPSGPAAQPVGILKYDNQLNDDGSYSFSYETENGISQSENGYLKNPEAGEEAIQVVEGSFSYTDDQGNVITVNYIADENGFQPQGDHLPTPPPTPEAILRALEQNAAEEAAVARNGGSQSQGYESSQGGSSQSYSGQQGGGSSQGYAGYKGGSSQSQQGSPPSQVYGAPNNRGQSRGGSNNGRRPPSAAPSFSPQGGYSYPTPGK